MHEKPVLLITGTSSGLGRELAEYFIGKKYIVIGCSRSSLEISNDNYHHFCLNISDEKSVKAMFRSIRKKFGYLDCLINNAGIATMNHALLTSIKEVKNVLDVNFIGVFLASREAAKLMKRNKFGRIINISSIHTNFNIKGTSIYGASKSAVEQFTVVLSNEILQYGITANVLSLSIVEDTGMSNAIGADVHDEILSKSKSKNYVKAVEVIENINYLMSSKANDYSGKIIQIG